jgi:hypothetical protein
MKVPLHLPRTPNLNPVKRLKTALMRARSSLTLVTTMSRDSDAAAVVAVVVAVVAAVVQTVPTMNPKVLTNPKQLMTNHLNQHLKMTVRVRVKVHTAAAAVVHVVARVTHPSLVKMIRPTQSFESASHVVGPQKPVRSRVLPA